MLLEAQPDVEHVFAKWIGTVCNGSTNATCSFKVGLSNVSITPSYRLRTNIIVMKDGKARPRSLHAADLNCPAPAVAVLGGFLRRKPVTLRATPATGSRFLGFSEQCTSTNRCARSPDRRHSSSTWSSS